jgi:hypothetical protein
VLRGQVACCCILRCFRLKTRADEAKNSCHWRVFGVNVEAIRRVNRRGKGEKTAASDCSRQTGAEVVERRNGARSGRDRRVPRGVPGVRQGPVRLHGSRVVLVFPLHSGRVQERNYRRVGAAPGAGRWGDRLWHAAGDSSLTLLCQCWSAMGQQPTEEELFQMISEVDEDMSGAIGQLVLTSIITLVFGLC